ncbi:hypothetical protein PVAP13_9KG036793 [Panicum virgatum]|uniref:Uncharacterized protein n=1 Tax=Panicum virgatum TaxID=38727 RepID=A0A8T0NAP0_PANVG|nr:hypothetical protein PVAP13_9KG036793 [Panicum virgatum]
MSVVVTRVFWPGPDLHITGHRKRESTFGAQLGLELKWAQQFVRLFGAAGRRHLRLLLLPGPARGPAWLALRPPLPPAPGAATLLCVRGERPSRRRWVSWPCWACADRAPPADVAPPPIPTTSPAAPRRRRWASPTVVRPAPPRRPPSLSAGRLPPV